MRWRDQSGLESKEPPWGGVVPTEMGKEMAMFSKWTPPLPLDFPDRAGRGHSLGELADFLSSDTPLTLSAILSVH